jgi:hypothetical protein
MATKRSRRAVLATGFGVGAATALCGPPKSANAGRSNDDKSPAAEAIAQPSNPFVIGVVDVEKAIKNYHMFVSKSGQIKADAVERQKYFLRIVTKPSSPRARPNTIARRADLNS